MIGPFSTGTMPLNPGTRLGVYQVTAKIGEGGMGEVYQARDTKLDRDVALKVLPEAFTSDPDRLARFEREAKVLASLNHPNIGSIYGVEEADGVKALVLELIEGPTLADRIKLGPIPVDEALPIARQIAEALGAAHEAGVIHRDLKPANIKVREDGTVKVLDFGLAKALDPSPAGDPDQSPTLTAAATQMGMVIGTAAYMSPEQARGKSVDKRADVWAFGVVVYEMLAATRPFQGEDVSLTLASVMKSNVDLKALPADVPAPVRTALHRCLQKDPAKRVRDIGDVRLAMDGAFETTMEMEPEPLVTPGLARWRWRVSTVIAGVVVVLMGAIATSMLIRPTPISQPTRRLRIILPTTDRLGDSLPRTLALSPDGQTLVYVATRDGNQQLFRLPLDQLDPIPIPNTEGATSPAFSPDGEWVAFRRREAGGIEKVSLSGGALSPVCAAPCGNRNASWASNDEIIVGTAGSPLSRVSAAGGLPEPMTTLSEGTVEHRQPHALPGGQAVLFTVSGSSPEGQVAVLSLVTGEYRILAEGTEPRFTSTGHLVFALSGSLWAVPFDLGTLDVEGTPQPVVEGVQMRRGASAQFAVGSEGSLVYVPGPGSRVLSSGAVWVDRAGKVDGAIVDEPQARYPSFSPDGQQLAVTLGSLNEGSLWVYDLRGRPPTPLTLDGLNARTVWHPDGTRVSFASDRGGQMNLFWMPADGSTLAPDQLLMSPNRQWPGAWSPDGRELIFQEERGVTGWDILALSIEDDAEPRVVVGTQFNELQPALSSNGRWLAYVSDVTGREEVWVGPYSSSGGSQRVSSNGGTEPVWSRDGQELFYLEGSKMMAVPVETEGQAFGFRAAVELFDEPFHHEQQPSYDVAPDGRFAMLVDGTDPERRGEGEQLVVVLNWTQELLELVPIP